MWAGRLAWLGRWLYEPKVAGSSPARPTTSIILSLESPYLAPLSIPK